MKLSFIVDSASDLKINDEYKDIPLTIVPLNVQFGEDHYLDGVTITEDEFYKRMSIEPELPKTSQPSPQSFFEAFQKELNKGNEVLYIGISSNLSGTVQSATIGKSMLTEEEQDRVTILDSGIASGGVQILLNKAIEMTKKDTSLKDIVQQLERTKSGLKGYVLLETLENVKKGGRISAVQGAIAGMLNIKPMISIIDGVVETIGKFRGSKKGLTKMKEMILEWKLENPEKTLYLIHSYSSAEEVEKEFHELFELNSFPKVIYTRFGSTIGTYASEKAIGFVAH
ncbi:DegV family protein [Fictibacillus phosphorivorans]|uniref:DegV family protein n=1 Tax=Fictibacillus phosphorivorans TaxID=1221500 RepID=UPI00203B645A|nr:DegV family protein [Fictibacillus phosphorivorans]MCM3719115.1 DegV family protein [Fictibacillus phosphorivorans]MCM3776737.1 DegV family protein [Fictibacillus phosphorivorans]